VSGTVVSLVHLANRVYEAATKIQTVVLPAFDQTNSQDNSVFILIAKV